MEFEDLYQEIILDHYKHPRNTGKINQECISVEHENPVCGDHITLMALLDDDDNVKDVKFQGTGCENAATTDSRFTVYIIMC